MAGFFKWVFNWPVPELVLSAFGQAAFIFEINENLIFYLRYLVYNPPQVVR